MVGAFVCNNVAIIVAKVYFACIILAVKLITMKKLLKSIYYLITGKAVFVNF